jgi:hypothetical protein
MLQQRTNKQLLDFLKYSIRLGENIITSETAKEALLIEYNERMEELIEYMKSNRSGMNLLVSWKIESLELYHVEKDYSPTWNKMLRLNPLSKKNKRQPDENIIDYVTKQNLLLGALEFYYRHV